MNWLLMDWLSMDWFYNYWFYVNWLSVYWSRLMDLDWFHMCRFEWLFLLILFLFRSSMNFNWSNSLYWCWSMSLDLRLLVICLGLGLFFMFMLLWFSWSFILGRFRMSMSLNRLMDRLSLYHRSNLNDFWFDFRLLDILWSRMRWRDAVVLLGRIFNNSVVLGSGYGFRLGLGLLWLTFINLLLLGCALIFLVFLTSH